MLNKKDKRNIILIIFALIVVIGGLILIRGCNRNEVEEKNPNNQETPVVEPDNQEVVEKEDTTQGNTNQYYVSNSISSTEEEEEEALYPEIELDSVYYAAILGEEFSIPDIPTVDKNGNPITVVGISYQFRELDSSEYVPVMEFSTKRLGTYMITYYVENEKQYVSEIVIYIDIIDDSAPIIEGMIEKYNEEENITEYIVVSSESRINQKIHFNFSDNDEIVYAYYYNEDETIIIDGDTIEQDATPTINEIDLTSDFVLSEENGEGKYIICVYDRSWNHSEFVVTLDFTPPEVEGEIDYQIVSDETGDFVQVTITLNEEVVLDDTLLEAGWEFSEDNKTITKLYEVYEGIVEDTIIVTDLAGNIILEPIQIQYEIQDEEEIDPDENDIEETTKPEESTILDTSDEISASIEEDTNLDLTVVEAGNLSDSNPSIQEEILEVPILQNNIVEIEISFDSISIMN